MVFLATCWRNDIIFLGYYSYMKLSQINNILVILIVIINVSVVAAPLVPSLQFWAQKQFSNTETQLTKIVESTNPSISTRSANSLVIPSLLIDEVVYEGGDASTLNKGIWRRPNTSSPDKAGNTVLVGHRFAYGGQSAFYNLDKVKVGQQFAVFWNSKKYVYQIVETKVVKATAIEIEAPTTAPTITLYTCTPLWSAKDRLVIVAKPINMENI